MKWHGVRTLIPVSKPIPLDFSDWLFTPIALFLSVNQWRLVTPRIEEAWQDNIFFRSLASLGRIGIAYFLLAFFAHHSFFKALFHSFFCHGGAGCELDFFHHSRTWLSYWVMGGSQSVAFLRIPGPPHTKMFFSGNQWRKKQKKKFCAKNGGLGPLPPYWPPGGLPAPWGLRGCQERLW